MVAREVTDKTLQGLKPAKPGRRYVKMDSDERGLGFRVNERGEISIVMIARFPGSESGQPARRTIGHYPSMSLAAARARAREWRNLIKAGTDPRVEEERIAEKKKAEERQRLTEAENTFAALAEAFIADRVVGPDLRKPLQRAGLATAREIRNEFVARWGSRRPADVGRADVIAYLKEKKRNAPGQARNLLGHLKTLFAWALNDGSFGLTGSPVHDIKAGLTIGPKQARDRELTDDELRAFWRAATRTSYPYGPLYQLLLLSGVRLNECADAQWPEFDLANGRWTIAANRMKGKNGKARPHVVPLTGDMLAILRDLPRFERVGPFLFSSTFGRKPVWVNDKVKRRLDQRMLRTLRALARARGGDPSNVELPAWVNHDLRRTVRTGLSRLRVADDVAEAVLAHARPGIVGVYDRFDRFDEKRAALERWASEVRRIVDRSPPADNVTHLALARARRVALLQALDRSARRRLLGLDQLLDEQRALGQGGGRRISVGARLKRDEVAQAVLCAQAFDPAEKLEAIVHRVAELYGVKRRYVFQALADMTPEREANAKAMAIALAQEVHGSRRK
jgi:integrase